MAREGRVSEPVQYWLDEIAASRKREKDFRKEGKRVREIYAGEKQDTTPFNILYSNTETMLPSLYSAVPRPIVQRRYKDEDPVATAAAKAGQRALEFMLDTNVEGYETFNDAIGMAVMDGLLPGRGITTVKYDYEENGEELQWQLACCEHRVWDRVYFGYARKWVDTPWVAYELFVDKKEAKRLFGDKAAKMQFSEGNEGESDDEGGREETGTMGRRKTACVYQIWDKDGGRKIRYVSPAYVDGYLREDDDPLGLTGFFTCPRPLQMVTKTADMTPVSLYCLYENQAKELNRITLRIKAVTEAIKAKGLYDGELSSDLSTLMEADDGVLVPIEKGSSLAVEKGLDKAIWFMPIEQLIVTLRELYAAREACKAVIYEITGISDIIRGASKASETLGAQQIKAQWGTLRLKPKQGEVQRYVRDILRMMLEIAATKFTEDTWARMTGLPFLTQEQMAQAQAVAQAAAMQGDMSAMQQLQGQITWQQVIAVLRDDMQRAYRIDIETNSTLEPEAVEDQKQVSEWMTAMGQFLNGVSPAIQQGVMPFEVAQSMLLAITRRFRFGLEVEDMIRAMKAPPPPPQDGSGEAAAAQEKLKAQEAAMGDKARIAQLETENARIKNEQALMKRETDLDVREIALKTQENAFQMQQKAANESLANKSQLESTKLDAKKQISGLEQKFAKTDQVVSKQLDTKMAQSTDKLAMLIQSLVEAVGAQAKETQALISAVKAPRKRKAIYGANGRIMESVDEAVQ